MNRRSFLRRFAQTVALATVAPAALASLPRAVKKISDPVKWTYSNQGIYAQLAACNRMQATPERIDIFTDRETASIIRAAMAEYYRGKFACESASGE